MSEVTINYTSGTDVGWANETYAWDKTDNTYATRTIPKNDVDDSANYLKGTDHDNSVASGIISKVEIGIEGKNDSGNTGYLIKIIPVFSGTTDGSVYTTTTLSQTDTTLWVDITSDGSAPSWSFTHIDNLDFRMYGQNGSSLSDVEYSIDQLYLRVTYTPSFPSIELSTHSLSAAYGDNTIIQNPPTQTFTVSNSGGAGTWLNWTAESSGGATWLSLDPSAGSIHTSASYTDAVSASFDCTAINRSTYGDFIKVFDVNADNSPHYVDATFTISGSGSFSESISDIFKLSDTSTNTADFVNSISDIFKLSDSGEVWLKEGEVTWGYETPSAGYALSWYNYINEAGATTPTSGNSDWGRIYIESNERSLSSVERIADDSNIEVMRDRYPSGGFGPIKTYIRGQDALFSKTTPSGTLAWTEYTEPVVKSWKYVQVMVEAL